MNASQLRPAGAGGRAAAQARRRGDGVPSARAAPAAATDAAAAAVPRGAGPSPVQLLTPSCDPAATARAVDALGAAFSTDPVLPLLGVRPERHDRFFRTWSFYLQKWARERVMYVAGGGDAVAIVADSRMAKAAGVGPLDALRCGALWEMALMPPASWGPLMRMLDALDASHTALEPLGVPDPYLKVVALATHPRAAGRGLGSAVMAEVAARADAEGLHVFLEAGPTGVEAFYRDKHGFDEIGAVHILEDLTPGGLRMPLMLRRPRAAPAAGATGA